MNVRVTNGAEGLARRAFTVAEVWRMVESGVLAPDERFELIEGELVPLSPKGPVHELVKSALAIALAKALPPDLWMGFETTLELSDATFVEPDLVVYPKRLALRDVRGPDVLLAVEVADTSLDYDLGPKARLFALHGIGELWVVNARERTTTVHTRPGREGWGAVETKTAGDALVPCAPALAHVRITLADVD
ncbi:MAG TPA: Uma2 family endonuclease [Beijerinckiaceae bacterium]|nr:Uma2 family endonuclease [Beijerinckiaceae bacterium]